MADTFLELTDTPASYSGADGDVVRVNGTPDGLEFTSVGTFNALLSFILLSDTPASYSSQGGKGVRVNSGENALEFVSIFVDGGEAGGADRTLGNTDNYDLSLITNNTARLHVQNDGKVGIGTTLPGALLHINGGNITLETGTLDIIANNQAVTGRTTAAASIRMLYCHTTDFTFLNGPSATGIKFAVAGTEKMRLTSAGRLGIGESSPDSLLHVSGDSITADYDGANIIFAGQGSGNDIAFHRDSTNLTLILAEKISSVWKSVWQTHIQTSGTDTPVFCLDPAGDYTVSNLHCNSTDYFEISSDEGADLYLVAGEAQGNSGWVVIKSNKTTSGDPASPAEGQLVINTSDNNIQIYADSGWRELASW